MVDAKLTAAIVTGVLSIVLIVIAVIISLSIGSKFPAGDTKSRLQASAALSGLTALFAIGTGVAGILYARAKATASTSARPLLIVMIVLAVITALMYITVLGLNLSVRALQDVSTTDKNALTAAIILIAIAFISLIISIVLFVSIRKAALVAKKTTTVVTSKPAEVVTESTTETKIVAKPPVPKRPAKAIIPARLVKSAPVVTTEEVVAT